MLRHDITPILVFPLPFIIAVVSIVSYYRSRVSGCRYYIQLLPRHLVGPASVGLWERRM